MKKPDKNVQTANEDGIAELIPKESKGKKILRTVINVILVIAIIIAAFCTYTAYVTTSGSGVPGIFGYSMMAIETGSMDPTIKIGDLIFDVPCNAEDLRINDVITYWTIIEGQKVLNTHRIVNIYDADDHLIFETKGDANTAADPLTVHEAAIVGQWKGARISGLGSAFQFLQTSNGFLFVVVIPVAIFFLYHLIQFFRVLFEYNNVKNKLAYEKERGTAEDMVEAEKQRQEELRNSERERLEAEIRAKLMAEMKKSVETEEAAPTDSDNQQ